MLVLNLHVNTVDTQLIHIKVQLGYTVMTLFFNNIIFILQFYQQRFYNLRSTELTQLSKLTLIMMRFTPSEAIMQIMLGNMLLSCDNFCNPKSPKTTPLTPQKYYAFLMKFETQHIYIYQ